MNEERNHRRAVGETELAGDEYAAAIGSKDPARIRAAREAFAEAQRRESRALDALVASRQPTFTQLLNDPMQQLDQGSEVLAHIYRYEDLTTDTACACTDPKCPRHLYRPAQPSPASPDTEGGADRG